MDRRGKGRGRNTDLPTKPGWHNTHQRGCQQQHTVAAWGSRQPLALGLSTNLSLTQTGPPLAQLWPSHEYIHARSMSPPCQKMPEAPNGKKGLWFSTAQGRGSTLEDQPHRAKRTLGDSPRLTVTLWSSHSSLGGFSGEEQTRRGNAQLAYNVLPKS